MPRAGCGGFPLRCFAMIDMILGIVPAICDSFSPGQFVGLFSSSRIRKCEDAQVCYCQR